MKRCKHYPKEGISYLSLPCASCVNLIEFIHCGIWTDEEDNDFYRPRSLNSLKSRVVTTR